jgi:hypothetical protein
MDRRGFFGALIGGVAVAAAARSWPFRVFSFPSQPIRWVGIDWGYNDSAVYVYYVHPAQAAAMKSLGGLQMCDERDFSSGTYFNLARSSYPGRLSHGCDAVIWK